MLAAPAVLARIAAVRAVTTHTISPVLLPRISPASPLHLPCICPISQVTAHTKDLLSLDLTRLQLAHLPEEVPLTPALALALTLALALPLTRSPGCISCSGST